MKYIEYQMVWRLPRVQVDRRCLRLISIEYERRIANAVEASRKFYESNLLVRNLKAKITFAVQA